MNAACSGFVYAMDTAHRFLKTYKDFKRKRNHERHDHNERIF